MNFDFFVAGIPVPKGSAKSFWNKNASKIVTMQDNREKQRPWASAVSYAAQQAGCRPAAGPIRVVLCFTFPRPKNHYGTGKNKEALKAAAPAEHMTKPDLDKLVRCVLDALTGIAYHDDNQVITINARKSYAAGDLSTGVRIMLLCN